MGLISRVSSRTYRYVFELDTLSGEEPLIKATLTRLVSNVRFNMSSELACTYAALILHDSDMEINVDNLNKASGVAVEPFWPGLFATALQGCDVAGPITN